jgi:UPF0716 family protein affecting phage T7 exclusion
VALVASALLLIKPGWVTDGIGLALLGAVLASQWLGRARDGAPASGN